MSKLNPKDHQVADSDYKPAFRSSSFFFPTNTMFSSHQKSSKCTYFCVENKVFSLFLSLVVLFNIDGVFHPGFSVNMCSL